MADLDLWIGTDQFDTLETKTNLLIDKVNELKSTLETLTAGQVPRQIDGTDFNFEGVLVPTLKTGEAAREKVRLSIGDWNMASSDDVDVAHGLSAAEWKTIAIISIIIRNDADDTYYTLARIGGAFDADVFKGGTVMDIDATNIRLGRTITGFFDDAAFNSTSYNRGFIDIEYTPV